MDSNSILFVLIVTLVINFIILYCLGCSGCGKENYVMKEEDVHKELKKIHSKLKLEYGSFDDEFPEQVMAYLFINPDDVVLEIGANIGRNTLIISELMNDDRNLVTLESDEGIAKQLNLNRTINGKKFKIVNAALSKRELIQKGWDTKVLNNGESIPKDWKIVNTVDLDYLNSISSKPFSTIVADCEGALYYILEDFPSLLDSVKTIIMENDYHDINQKTKVDNILKNRGFKRVYYKNGGWGPCSEFFFEVWKN